MKSVRRSAVTVRVGSNVPTRKQLGTSRFFCASDPPLETASTMFRSRKKSQNEMNQFIFTTNLDMANLERDMRLKRTSSLRRLKTALKPPPESCRAHYPVDKITSLPSSVQTKESVPIRRYPPLDEVARLPSSRHFSKMLEDEFTQKEPSHLQEYEENKERGQTHDGCHDSTSDEGYNVYIEIAPGVVKLLRGSEETQRAWDSGLCEHVSCAACEAELACVWDCELVLCPECHSLSPNTSLSGLNESLPSLESSVSSLFSESEGSLSQGVTSRGVGLGIKIA